MIEFSSSPKRFTVKPNPAKAGGSVTIRGVRKDVLYVLAGGARRRIVLDAKGSAVVQVPVGAGKSFVISDFHPDDTHEIEVKVGNMLK